jgi:hypothetical protein
MKARQYRNVILQSLKQGRGKYTSIDSMADYLISAMTAYEEMYELVRQEVLGGAVPTEERDRYEPPETYELRGVIGSNAVREEAVKSGRSWASLEPDISQRLTVTAPIAGNGVLSEKQYEELKGKAIQLLNRDLPMQIQADVAGFVEPIVLIRNVQNTQGLMPYVKVIYAQQGADLDTMGCKVYVDVDKPSYTAAQIIDEVKSTARLIYRPQVNKIEPRFAIPPPSNLDEGLRGAPNAEADEGPQPIEWRDGSQAAIAARRYQ